MVAADIERAQVLLPLLQPSLVSAPMFLLPLEHHPVYIPPALYAGMLVRSSSLHLPLFLLNVMI